MVSWNSGPARDSWTRILGKLRSAGVAEEFDVILRQELPGQRAHPMTPANVKDLLHNVSPLNEACW